MPFPNHPDKHAEDALVVAATFHDYLRRMGTYPTVPLPESVLLCFQASTMEHVREHHPGRAGDGYLKSLWIPDGGEGRVGVVGDFGIGAPVAAVKLEDLVEFGAKRVVVLGTAGSLQEDLEIGDHVLCTRAIRDEGTSHHYLPPATYAHASPDLTAHVAEALDRRGLAYRKGTSWTIDTPYRETKAEVSRYASEGVLTVEMEAAALFAVAARRGIEIAAAFTISDSLAGLRWDPHFGSPTTRRGLETLLAALLDALRE